MNLSKCQHLTRVGQGAGERGDQLQLDSYTEVGTVALSFGRADLGAAVKPSKEVLGMGCRCGKAGETTRGHLRGDACAGIGIIRRMSV